MIYGIRSAPYGGTIRYIWTWNRCLSPFTEGQAGPFQGSHRPATCASKPPALPPAALPQPYAGTRSKPGDSISGIRAACNTTAQDEELRAHLRRSKAHGFLDKALTCIPNSPTYTTAFLAFPPTHRQAPTMLVRTLLRIITYSVLSWFLLAILWLALPSPSRNDDGSNYATAILTSGKTLTRVYEYIHPPHRPRQSLSANAATE